MNRARAASTLGIAALALLALFGRSGLATGGEDPLAPLPGTLDEMLASALRRNPEILVEEARVREAQASLNQARLAVTQKVVQLHFEREEQQRVLGQVAKEFQRQRTLFEAGSTSEGELRQTEIIIAQSEGALARIEAELRYAMGHGGTLPEGALLSDPRGASSPNSGRPEAVRPPAPVPADIAEALDRAKLTVDFQETPIEDVLALLASSSGLEFLAGPSIRDQGIVVTLRLRGETSARKLIHALADLTDVTFVVREYGLLAVWRGEAPEGAAVLPPREE